MVDEPKKDQWVFVAVEDPGGNENFVGLHDEKNDLSYIPAFYTKDDALSCLINMPRRENKKYEVQAVMFELLCEDARQHGYQIFMTDGEGRITNRIAP